jgi:hypothetical protein
MSTASPAWSLFFAVTDLGACVTLLALVLHGAIGWGWVFVALLMLGRGVFDLAAARRQKHGGGHDRTDEELRRIF